MSTHLLTQKAFVYPRSIIKDDPDDARYDTLNGYWITGKKTPLVKTSKLGPRTKKADIETGEDLKGE